MLENVKHITNGLISFIGAFPSYWPIAYEYALIILHHCASSYPNSKVPSQVISGQCVGLYSMLAFFFWKHVNYEVDDCSFLSESIKQGNCFVGMTKDTGHSFYGLNVLRYLFCTVPLLIEEPGHLKNRCFQVLIDWIHLRF